MSDLVDAIKYLDRTPARAATSADLAQSSSLPTSDKYLKRTPIRHFKKIPAVFYIADQVFIKKNTGQRNFILVQLGYSFSRDFYITKWPKFLDQADQLINCDLFVKYRIGTAVTRYHFGQYHLGIGQEDYELDFTFAPQYNGQLIKKNFVMELWTKLDLGNVQILSSGDTVWGDPTPYGLRFETNIRTNPTTAEEVETIGSEPTIIKDELNYPLPIVDFYLTETFSFDPLNAWLDNT